MRRTQRINKKQVTKRNGVCIEVINSDEVILECFIQREDPGAGALAQCHSTCLACIRP